MPCDTPFRAMAANAYPVTSHTLRVPSVWLVVEGYSRPGDTTFQAIAGKVYPITSHVRRVPLVCA